MNAPRILADPSGLVQADREVLAPEGAFLPCAFWLATVLAMQSEDERAEAILDRMEETAGALGLLPKRWTRATARSSATRRSCSAMPST